MSHLTELPAPLMPTASAAAVATTNGNASYNPFSWFKGNLRHSVNLLVLWEKNVFIFYALT